MSAERESRAVEGPLFPYWRAARATRPDTITPRPHTFLQLEKLVLRNTGTDGTFTLVLRNQGHLPIHLPDLETSHNRCDPHPCCYPMCWLKFLIGLVVQREHGTLSKSQMRVRIPPGPFSPFVVERFV